MQVDFLLDLIWLVEANVICQMYHKAKSVNDSPIYVNILPFFWLSATSKRSKRNKLFFAGIRNQWRPNQSAR